MTDLSPEAVERLAVMLDHDDKRHQTTGSRVAETLRAQAAEIERLTDALNEAQSERLEQARLLGMSAEREMDLRGQMERLLAALRPFGEYGFDGPNGLGGVDLDYQGNPLPDHEGVGWMYLTHGDFRRARAALPIPDREGA